MATAKKTLSFIFIMGATITLTGCIHVPFLVASTVVGEAVVHQSLGEYRMSGHDIWREADGRLDWSRREDKSLWTGIGLNGQKDWTCSPAGVYGNVCFPSSMRSYTERQVKAGEYNCQNGRGGPVTRMVDGGTDTYYCVPLKSTRTSKVGQ